MIRFSELGTAGRLGNQMWQIAGTIGIAHARGDRPTFPDWDYRPYFQVPDTYFSDQPGIEARTLVPHMDERCALYLQDYGLFADITPVVRAVFRPSPLATQEMRVPKYDWFWELGGPVALHVRRGDMLTEPDGYHPLTTTAYYERALDLVGRPVVVFSDDLPWCRETFGHFDDMYFFEGSPSRVPDYDPGYAESSPTDWLDLQFMAACSDHIIANSTYSWWGAFLAGNPHPIYPLTWFGSKLRYIDWKLQIPPGWRGIEC